MSASVFIKDPKTQLETRVGAFEGEAIFGQSDAALIQVKDLRCEGIHALVETDAEKNRFRITDLGTQFGTFVGRERIQEKWLKFGDSFSIGRQTYVIRPDGGGDHAEEARDRSMAAIRAESFVRKTREATLPSARTLLQVALYWGEQLLEQRTFNGRSEITIGNQQTATFGVTLLDPILQAKPFRIARYARNSLTLDIPKEAKGLIWTGEEAHSVDTFRHLDRATQEFGRVQTTLRVGDRANIEVGELSLQFRFVEPATAIKERFFPKFDPTFFKITAGVLGAFMLFGVIATLLDHPPAEVKLSDIPESLKRAKFDAGIAQATRKRRSAIGDLAQDKVGGRAGGEEGRVTASRTPAPAEPKTKASAKTKTAKTKAQAKQKFAKKAAPSKNPRVIAKAAPRVEAEPEVDLNAAFGSSKKPAKNQKAPAMAGAQQNGNTIAALTDPGSFARGTKGNGGGGGGQGYGIGQLTGTSTGGGMGSGDIGLAPSKGREIRAPASNEEIVIEGGLDRDVIASIVKRYLPQIQHCYEKSLVSKPKLKGKVMASFVIGGSGGVDSAEVVESSLADEPTENCIVGKILTWKFPKPRGGGTVGVKYPFLLMSSGGK